MLASTSAMGHQHQWQSEPPEGKLFWNKSFDQRYGDEEDMASNAMFSSPEEIQRLRLLVKKDPSLETSSSWPLLVEWCSSCTSTRAVKLVLPIEGKEVLEEMEEAAAGEKVGGGKESCDATAKDASTQTSQPKPRRRGGQGSRTRRMLAYQLMLTVKRGLPLSRLLLQKNTNTRTSLKLQEESASPHLRVEKVEMKEEKKGEEMEMHTVKVEKEEENCPKEKVSTGGSTLFTPRSSQTGDDFPSPQPHPHCPSVPPFSVPPPPLFTPTFIPLHPTPQFGQMPCASWGFCGGCHAWGNVFPMWVIQ